MDASQKAIIESTDKTMESPVDEIMRIVKLGYKYEAEWDSVLRNVGRKQTWFEDHHAIRVIKDCARAKALSLAHFRPHSDGKYNQKMMTTKASRFIE